MADREQIMEAARREVVSHLRKMTETPGWKHLEKDFQYRIDELQEMINTVSREDNDRVYTEKDVMIKEMKILVDILNYLPDYVAKITPPTLDDDEMDPYNR
jgi:hypothetical protein